MDKDTKDYFDRMWLGLTAKEDLEKLRQEMKSSFRQLREENKNQILEWKQEIKTDIEQLKKETKMDSAPLLEEFRKEVGELKTESHSAFDQSIQKMEHLLDKIQEEAKSRPARQKEGAEMNAGSLKVEMEGLENGVKRMGEEVASLRDKMKEGFVELKEELGSMIKFSFADLEKKVSALEARIKALEKMVFP